MSLGANVAAGNCWKGRDTVISHSPKVAVVSHVTPSVTVTVTVTVTLVESSHDRFRGFGPPQSN